MTKRDIKRLAYFHAGLVLQNALDAGWEIDTIENLETEQDRDNFLQAMRTLINNMVYVKGKK